MYDKTLECSGPDVVSVSDGSRVLEEKIAEVGINLVISAKAFGVEFYYFSTFHSSLTNFYNRENSTLSLCFVLNKSNNGIAVPNHNTCSLMIADY